MDYKNYQNFDELANRFKTNYPGLTEYETLKSAIEYQKNQILVAGLAVSQNDLHPSAIEMVAIGLKGLQP